MVFMYVCTMKWMNEMFTKCVCVSRGKKERGFNFIDWTRLGPCMEGKGEEFPMRSAVLLGSKKLLKKDLSGNWERRGEVRNVRPGVGVKLFLPWEFHTHQIRNFFTSLISTAHGSIGMIARLLSSGSFVSNVFISYSFHQLVLHVTQDNATQFAEACAKTQAVQWRDRREA